MLTGGASELTHVRCFHKTSFYFQRFAFDQDLGDLFVGRFDNASEGWAGDIHPLRGFFLVQTLQVGQADRFQFVQGQRDLLKGRERNPPGFIINDPG
jgi:hypothetical protein